MNVTKHAMKRYAERIDHVSKEEINRYVSTNEEELFINIGTMFEHAKFIWRGQLYDNVTRNYYLNTDVILVTNTDDSAVITLYRIDFGFPIHTNRIVISDLLTHIQGLQEDLSEAETGLLEHKELLESEIDALEQQIKITSEQVESLKSHHKLKVEERKSIATKNLFLVKEIEKNAVLLCNSLDYKNDLKEMAR